MDNKDIDNKEEFHTQLSIPNQLCRISYPPHPLKELPPFE